MSSKMHPKGIELINIALKNEKIQGPNLKCEYYPCHNILEDCTFCYCPFYPCNNPITGGHTVISSQTHQPVWACEKCVLCHRSKNAQFVLDALRSKKCAFEKVSRKELLEIHDKLLNFCKN